MASTTFLPMMSLSNSTDFTSIVGGTITAVQPLDNINDTFLANETTPFIVGGVVSQEGGDDQLLNDISTIIFTNQTTEQVYINESGPGIISDDLLTYLDLGIGLPMCVLASLLGILTNSVNIVVFWQQGLQGTVTLAYFALAWSDFGLCLTSLETLVALSIHVYLDKMPRITTSVHYLTGAYVRAMFYAISGYLTLFAAIEQCLNIALPFQMKRFRSNSRTVIIIILIYALCILLFAPHFIAQGIRRWDGEDHSTVTQWFMEKAKSFEVLASTFSGIFTPTVNQILMIVSSTKMTSVLRASLEFRSKSTVQTNNQSDPKDGKKIYNLSERDRILLMMVNMVSIIFIACNFPVMVIVYCRRLIPGLTFTGRYRNLHTALHWIVIFCGSFNAAVNIFIYMKLSSKFKRAFKTIFEKASETSEDS